MNSAPSSTPAFRRRILAPYVPLQETQSESVPESLCNMAKQKMHDNTVVLMNIIPYSFSFVRIIRISFVLATNLVISSVDKGAF